MNLGAMRIRFYDFLQASSTKGPWSTALANGYIHEGHMRMFQRVAFQNEGFFRTTANVTEVAGQSTYNLPTNTFRVDSIERIAGSNAGQPYFLQRVSYQSDFIQTLRFVEPMRSGVAVPEAYYQNGQKTFTLIRASTANVTNAFRVTYAFEPAEMTADSHVPFQATAGVGGAGFDNLSSFHDLIVWYAIENAAMQSEEALNPLLQNRIAQRERELDVFLRPVNTEPKFVNITSNAWDY